MQRSVLVTGASGFIGRDLVSRLAHSGWRVRAAARRPEMLPAFPGIETVKLPELARNVDWRGLLDGVGHVVHLAGIAHAVSTIPDATYMAVNADAVGNLARAARERGVSRIVMMSSVRAQCGPFAEGVVDEAAAPAPVDGYGRSKRAGEMQLETELAGSDTGWCVLRPVVVYGPAVKGNVATLVRLARSPLPLPIGGLAARRSLLGLENLASGVEHAMMAPAAAGRVFLVADPGPMTIPEMVAVMRTALGRQPALLKVPLSPLRVAATLAGRGDAWQRIAGDLVVSTARLEASGWRPRETAAEGIRRWMQGAGDRR